MAKEEASKIMRIIAGKFGGIVIEKPKTLAAGKTVCLTRPTMDRVKQSVFDVLYGRLSGARVLDVFAGSGSLGLEAMSRGAACATFVDSSREACDVIGRNCAKIGTKQKILNMTIEKALAELDEQFDIIFLDPPFDTRLGEQAIEQICKHNTLANDGIIVFETRNKDVPKHLAKQIEILRLLKYGDKLVYILASHN